MNDSAYRVETAPRLAQWRIDSLSSCTYRKSDPFRIGLWNWYLSVERNKQVFIRLFPEPSALTRERPPIASFVIRVICPAGDRHTVVHPGISEKQLKSNEDFVWAIETPSTGKVIIDVEFLDLKTVQGGGGGEPASIWSGEHHLPERAAAAALSSFALMLAEGIHTDITIHATDGSIGAHRAVLAARSPVFRSMFAYNLREKELSAVDITDMSSDACRAFLGYVYGSARPEEFLEHRLALLRAADKYDIADLREACQESLAEDIDTSNVLERLNSAFLYRLPRLKRSCMRYLVTFGKIYDVRDDFNAFLQCVDRDLIVDVFAEILAAWKGL